MGRKAASVLVEIDGGARGNPGPAAAGVIVRGAGNGRVLFAGAYFLGRATNNVAEYQGLVLGLTRAADLGATTVEVRSDSELLVRQMNGQYRVRNAGLKPLFEQACRLRDGFEQCAIRHVRREDNADADALANQAMDSGRNVADALDGG